MEKNMISQLLDFQNKISVIKKDSRNPHFKNTYASLTTMLSEVKPVLSDVGIVILQPILAGKVLTELHFGKEIVKSEIDLPVGLQPQALGSAITYFRRYTLSSLLSLEIDDDDATTASPTAAPLPALLDRQFLAMLESIKKGEKAKVKLAMLKYTLLPQQLKTLNDELI